jgi:hypothetical protein
MICAVAFTRLACATVLTVAVCGFAVACDSQSGTPRGAIFWTQSPHGGEKEHGGIGRADLTGSGADGHFIVGAKAPAGVAVNGRYIYWANYGSGTIARARLDGSDVNERFVKGAEDPIGVAVDDRHIYWTNSGIDPNTGTIGDLCTSCAGCLRLGNGTRLASRRRSTAGAYTAPRSPAFGSVNGRARLSQLLPLLGFRQGRPCEWAEDSGWPEGARSSRLHFWPRVHPRSPTRRSQASPRPLR